MPRNNGWEINQRTTGEYFELLKFAEAQERAKQAMQYYEQRTILKARQENKVLKRFDKADQIELGRALCKTDYQVKPLRLTHMRNAGARMPFENVCAHPPSNFNRVRAIAAVVLWVESLL